MSRWTEDTTFKFVEEYVRNECLWNFKLASYKNKQTKQKAINDIAEVMSIPNFGAKEVLLKIKSIRSTYSQELKKIKDSTICGSGTDEKYKTTLKWFDILDQSLKSVNICEARTTQDNTEKIEEPDYKQIVANGNEKESQEFVTPAVSFVTRKRRLRELSSLVDKVGDAVKTINAASTATENEFDLFSKSVASQLKAMPLTLALQAQQHIQNYLCQLRIQHIINSRATPSPIQVTTSYNPSTSPTLDSDTPSESLIPYASNGTEYILS